eukprot:CAMPEP_0196171882 /NCGR_PEP_ID=MMETSP0911-20130528/5749_1 /TAXON_ID=49265 /ORGANISM="Thalassiosira rotula, Strain GSO102" /LENGTH=55 /DNA_ID=CAMNT_0041438789 /DNA_START=103 /DNA_END=270 /DNA_ORIENTATION=-
MSNSASDGGGIFARRRRFASSEPLPFVGPFESPSEPSSSRSSSSAGTAEASNQSG